MKLKHKNNIFEIELQKSGENFSLYNQSDKLDFSLQELNDNSFLINTNSTKKNIYYFKDRNSITINVDGSSYIFEVVDEDSFNDYSNSENKNSDIIKSPMPGSVIKVLVNSGDLVEEGTALIIIEAMKMETTLYSSINGKVIEVNAKNGEQISPDKELIKIEKIID